MLLSYRRVRRIYLRPVIYLLGLCLLIDTILLVHWRPPTYRVSLDHTRQWDATPAPRANTTVFIASVHRNNEAVLLEGWNEALLSLIDYLGADNVFVSIVEGGSQDKTKDVLRDLQARLDDRGVPNKVELGMTVWQQIEEINNRPAPDAPRKPGWIWWEEGKRWDLRRIPYLSRVRNQALEPLLSLDQPASDSSSSSGKRYDKVLWLNDVVFDTQDLATLLATNDGDYAAACSMDFKTPPFYYDTFALRDDLGYKSTSLYWPWFQSGRARRAVWRSEPVRVKSCWNGIVVFDAEPFYGQPSPLYSSTGVARAGSTGKEPLIFRGVPDSLADMHLEGSECCLIHADNHLSAEKGVWLNPNVRVGYSAEAYRQVRADAFPTAAESMKGTWTNRMLHLRMRIQEGLEGSTVRKRIRQWQKTAAAGEARREEPGDFCLINEMQIMYENGWKHI
ncbi:Cryptococcal mannosyltransferase 1 [Microdochium nivale]|nr:Cryptococcal mannosyltransferase 1 [Microdochium nivale]